MSGRACNVCANAYPPACTSTQAGFLFFGLCAFAYLGLPTQGLAALQANSPASSHPAFRGVPTSPPLRPLQVASTTVGVGALIPQILLNLRQGNSGEWSLVTASLSTAGNVIRVLTTLQLTQDPILLAV